MSESCSKKQVSARNSVWPLWRQLSHGPTNIFKMCLTLHFLNTFVPLPESAAWQTEQGLAHDPVFGWRARQPWSLELARQPWSSAHVSVLSPSFQKGTYSPYHWSGAVLGTANRTDRLLLRSLGNGGVRQAAMGVHRQWSVERNRVFWAERIAHRRAQKRKRGMF